jgi:molybdate transport system permease protein
MTEIVLEKRIERRDRHDVLVIPSRERDRTGTRSPIPERWRRDLWQLTSLPLLLFFLLPLAAVLVRTPPASLLANLRQPAVQQAIALSLGTACLTTFLAVLLGTPLGYLLARQRFPMRRAVDILVDLPTVLPPAVAGVALLMAFGQRGLLGGALDSLGIHLAFTPLAVVLAQLFVAAPFYVRAAAVGFSSIEPEMVQAAALDGASSWQAFRSILLPLARIGLLSGAVMTWARAVGEFGATMIFAGNYPGRTQTMPLAIYLGFELDLDVALTLAVILVGCSFLVLASVKSLLQRERQTLSER